VQLARWKGPGIIVWLLAALVAELLASLSAASSMVTTDRDTFNYVVATQSAGALYKFTEDTYAVETARRMLEMGSNVIKMPHPSCALGQYLPGIVASHRPTEADLATILDLPFTYYFFWFRGSWGVRPNDYWTRGMTAADKHAEYEAMYEFATRLLRDYGDSGKVFFLGHWEGDWLLLNDFDTKKDASDVAIRAMTDFLTVRQQALDQAKRDVPARNVSIYQYAEVNQVRDAMLKGRRRMVNAVIPSVDVDYVSVSAWDFQDESERVISETLDFIQSNLRPKPGIPGKRVFVTELGAPAHTAGFDPAGHAALNRARIAKFMKWRAPFILYWEMYSNELLADGVTNAGFWLIDEHGRSWPLFEALQSFLRDAKKMVGDFERGRGRVPTSEEYLAWAAPDMDASTGIANLAAGRTAIASSSAGAATPASSATDDDIGTRWSPGSENRSWLYVDLGEEYDVGRVVLQRDAPAATGVEIQVLGDGRDPQSDQWTSVCSTTVGSGASEDVRFTAAAGRYVRVLFQRRVPVAPLSLWELQVWGARTRSRNLALGKAAYATTRSAIDHAPAKAIDGIASTGWSSTQGGPQSLFVDLGQTYEIERVVIQWGAAYGTRYQVQVLDDGLGPAVGPWRTVHENWRGEGGTDDCRFAPTTGRYVKVYVSGERGRQGVSIQELEVMARAPSP
jgi:hypothetical protein